jgi:hypothetical protein
MAQEHQWLTHTNKKVVGVDQVVQMAEEAFIVPSLSPVEHTVVAVDQVVIMQPVV